MNQARIIDWLNYWSASRMVNLDAIRAFEHVHLARKFCSCMRVGVFAEVSDLAIWRALVSMRKAANDPA